MPNFTDLTVRSLPEGLHFDERLPGFGIRVGKNRRTWLVVKGANRTKVRLGHYPDLSLADARKRALVALGSPLEPASSISFPDALNLFLAQDKWKPRSKYVLESSLRQHFKWTRPIDKITHEDVAQVLDGITAKSARAHALKDIRTFFNWCVPRYLKHSPAEGLKMPPTVVRERVLTDDELVQVWRVAEQTGYPFGTIIQLLILTGQRRGEIAALQSDWIKEDRITLPSWLTKNKREHTFPIGSRSSSLLSAGLPKTGTLIFPARSTGDGSPGPFSGFGASKATFDKRCKIAPWTLHDLRRTFATNLAALGTPIHVTEKILNHVSGTTGGLVGVYQKHSYWPEQVAAVTAWETRLQSLLSR